MSLDPRGSHGRAGVGGSQARDGLWSGRPHPHAVGRGRPTREQHRTRRAVPQTGQRGARVPGRWLKGVCGQTRGRTAGRCRRRRGLGPEQKRAAAPDPLRRARTCDRLVRRATRARQATAGAGLLRHGRRLEVGLRPMCRGNGGREEDVRATHGRRRLAAPARAPPSASGALSTQSPTHQRASVRPSPGPVGVRHWTASRRRPGCVVERRPMRWQSPAS